MKIAVDCRLPEVKVPQSLGPAASIGSEVPKHLRHALAPQKRKLFPVRADVQEVDHFLQAGLAPEL